MLLVLNIVYQGKISAAHVATDLHRNRTWVCVWLKRYEKEGLEALKNKPRTGRPSVIKRRYLLHKNNVKRKQQSRMEDHKTGWGDGNREKRDKISLYSHIPSYPSKMGFQTEGAKKGAC